MKNEYNELFFTETDITLQEYKKYFQVLAKKNWHKLRIYINVTLMLAILIFSLNHLYNTSDGIIKVVLMAIIWVIIVIFLNILAKMIMEKYISSCYKKMVIANQNNMVCNTKFYENYLEQTLKEKLKIEYNKLYGIIETSTNFYLMINYKQAIIIVKNNCTQELIEFIQNLSQRYNNKKLSKMIK